jgi:hypothetical protein
LAYTWAVMDMHEVIKALGDEVAEKRRIGTTDLWKQQPLAALFAWYACPAVQDIPDEQILAIIDKYVSAHPEQWHVPMTILIENALSPLCKDHPGTSPR